MAPSRSSATGSFHISEGQPCNPPSQNWLINCGYFRHVGEAPPNQISACGKYISTVTFLQKAGLIFFSWKELCTIENCIFQGHIFEFELEFQIFNYHAEQSFASRKIAL